MLKNTAQEILYDIYLYFLIINNKIYVLILTFLFQVFFDFLGLFIVHWSEVLSDIINISVIIASLLIILYNASHTHVTGIILKMCITQNIQYTHFFIIN